jgi:nucleoside-diphosphate-sugar epimerase
VFHLAAKAKSLPHRKGRENEYLAVNVEGTVNVLRGAAEAGASRLVYFSSVKAMGESTRDCVDESFPARPTTAYGQSKLQAERLILEQGQRCRRHAVCLRLPLVYGAGHGGNLLKMVAAVDRGLFPPLSDRGPLRSMVHVGNVVEAALTAATHPASRGQRYIVTDARAYPVREVYELICRGLGRRVPRWKTPVALLRSMGYVGDALGTLSGRPLPFNSAAVAKLVEPACYSSAKIAAELGFEPRLTLEQALPEIIGRYRDERGYRAPPSK